MFRRTSKEKKDEGRASRSPPVALSAALLNRFEPPGFAFIAETRIRSGAKA